MWITVINKLEVGYIVMASNGETAYIDEETYQKLVNLGKIK